MYEHLEGQKVVVISGEYTYPGVVALIERDMGVTIVRADDLDAELACLNHKEMVDVDHPKAWTQEQYDLGFDLLIKGIDKGDVDITAIMQEVWPEFKLGISSSHSVSCAFK